MSSHPDGERANYAPTGVARTVPKFLVDARAADMGDGEPMRRELIPRQLPERREPTIPSNTLRELDRRLSEPPPITQAAETVLAFTHDDLMEMAGDLAKRLEEAEFKRPEAGSTQHPMLNTWIVSGVVNEWAKAQRAKHHAEEDARLSRQE